MHVHIPTYMLAVLYHSITPINSSPTASVVLCLWCDGSIGLAWPQLRTQSMTNERGLSLITWTVITVLSDKIADTPHAQLLTTLAVPINYLHRCDETEQVANAIDRCTFDLFFLKFWLTVRTLVQTWPREDHRKVDAHADGGNEGACKYRQMVVFQVCAIAAGMRCGQHGESDFSVNRANSQQGVCSPPPSPGIPRGALG